MVIWGDFDGDNKVDTLVEKFTDSTESVEVPKYFDSLDIYDFHKISHRYKFVNVFNSINNQLIRSFYCGGLGISFIENCGDVNLDGKDDIAIVFVVPQMSNLTQMYFYSYQNNEWHEITSFPVWYWQFGSAKMMNSIKLKLNYNLSNQFRCKDSLTIISTDVPYFTRYKDNSIEFECRNFYDYDEIDKGFEKYGQQGYMGKYFKKVKLGHKWYFQDLKRPYLYLGNCTDEFVENQRIVICGIETPADMIKVRINLKHPYSAFKSKLK